MTTFIPGNDREYRTWLAKNSGGYVLNGDKPRTKAHYPMLHRANCGQISSPNRSNYVDAAYYKVCAATPPALVSWARSNFRREPTRCGICHP